MQTTDATAKGGAEKLGLSKVKPDKDGRVQRVLMAKVDQAVVDKYLAKAELPVTGTPEEKVNRLAKYFEKVTPRKEVGDCPDCGGSSDMRPEVCPECPYCGAKDDAPAAPKPAAKATTNGAGQALVQKQKGKAALAPAADAPESRFTEADLDAALGRVQEARRAEFGSYWDHGQAIHAIFADKLYLQRRDAKTKQPLYKTWTQFCAAELGVTSGTAYRLMDVAKGYDRETAISLGVRKCNALLRIEDADQRKALLPEAKKLSADEVEVRVSKVVNAAGGKATTRGDRERAPTPAAQEQRAKASKAATEKREAGKKGNVAPPPAPAQPKDTLTVALALGKTKVKLFKKGEKLADPDAKRTKRLADGAVGAEETANGVRTRYSVTADAQGNLQIEITRERVPA